MVVDPEDSGDDNMSAYLLPPVRYPYLGPLDDHETLTVAVSGNGHGARDSDEIGRLASTIVLE